MGPAWIFSPRKMETKKPFSLLTGLIAFLVYSCLAIIALAWAWSSRNCVTPQYIRHELRLSIDTWPAALGDWLLGRMAEVYRSAFVSVLICLTNRASEGAIASVCACP
jgi:hypothetical protein